MSICILYENSREHSDSAKCREAVAGVCESLAAGEVRGGIYQVIRAGVCSPWRVNFEGVGQPSSHFFRSEVEAT